MDFHPDVLKLYRIFIQSGVRPLAMETVEGARAFVREKTVTFGGPAAPMAEIRNLAAPGPAGNIGLRLYRPPAADSQGPAVIFVHGGGWVVGDLESHDTVCRAIAAQTPCRVVAIDYRLAPEHRFPASLDDVLAAIAWIAGEAPSLGIDPSRIAIAGDSAGGNMSAVACLDARDRRLRLRAQALIYPSTDMSDDAWKWPSRLENKDVFPLNEAALKWFAEKVLPKDGAIDTRDWRFSPIYAETLEDLPPALVITAQYDTLRDEGAAYGKRLAAAGVPTVYREYAGLIHGFIEYGGILAPANEAIAEVSGFLRQNLY
jgi:acetyl esterase